METILGITQVLLAIGMIAIILVQRGPGAAAGSGFGAGASGTVFGARGSGSFLTRTTAVLATAFFVISMGLAILASRAVVTTDVAPDLGVMSGAVQEASTADEVPPAPQIGDTGEISDVPALPEANSESAAAGEEDDGGQDQEEDPGGN
ncbi:MAG: preprotein translocase subunit SecG [Xanthomonadales bacterium]|nr:preprotein translocase subunit SecG [Xanthomonadales bacterium]